MLYAVIDIGSSIIKYKIYDYSDDNLEAVIINDKMTGLISYRKDDKLTSKGINVLLDTLKELMSYSDKLNVEKNYFYATASLRNIENRDEVLEIVREKLGIEIIILTGEEEAKHSFNSINWIDIPKNDGLLVDIGGGSSEVSIFENKTPLEQKSIPMGVLKIYNEYVSLLLPTKKEQELIIEEVREKIRELDFMKTSGEYLYGIGKSIVILKKLFSHLGYGSDENIIDIEDVDRVLHRLSTNSKENFKPLLIVDSERVHTMIPCLLIIKAIALEFNIEKVFVCNVTLQDGLILDIIENNK